MKTPQDIIGGRKTSQRVVRRNTSLIKHILVPTDFSPASKKALQYASKFAAQLSAQISVMNVLEPLPNTDTGKLSAVVSGGHDFHDAQQALDCLATQEVAEDVLKSAKVSVGKAYEQIVKSAKNLKADLIIIASHGYLGTKEEIVGSTTERVVRYAPCPVLVVRD